jgi:hypothetical protein
MMLEENTNEKRSTYYLKLSLSLSLNISTSQSLYYLRVAIWPFLKLFARNKMVWPFGHFLAFFEC